MKGGERVFPATSGPVLTTLAARLLQGCGVTLARSELARNADAAAAFAEITANAERYQPGAAIEGGSCRQ